MTDLLFSRMYTQRTANLFWFNLWFNLPDLLACGAVQSHERGSQLSSTTITTLENSDEIQPAWNFRPVRVGVELRNHDIRRELSGARGSYSGGRQSTGGESFRGR